jgi:hypothetical protein
MRHKTFLLPIIFMFLFVITCAFAAVTKAQTTQKSTMEVEEPESQFEKAHEFFLKKDLKAAASEIRKGVAFLKQEAGSAAKDGKKDLTASIHELEKLANEVEKGAVTSEKRLKDAFARAHQALANHHYLKASEYWAKKEEKKAGHALKSAAIHFEHAVVWFEHKFETGEDIVIKDIHTVAGKLVEGKKWTAEEVSKGIKDIGSEISKLGKKTKPKNK